MCPTVGTEHWEWLIFRCFRTWITRICRTIPWPTQKDGPPACLCRGTRLTTRPPSEWSMAQSTSSPRGTGSCLPPNGVFGNGFVLALYALPNTAWHDKLVSLVERVLELHKRSPRLPQEKESLQR